MRFYSQSHQFTCGVDLHGRSMYLCILGPNGEKLLHRNMPTRPEVFLEAIAPYRGDLVIGCECVFCWYWLADLCQAEGIPFVLGHALAMRWIHGTKSKSDKLDSEKIARLLRSGTFPLAYVYPKKLRATRDLLRRRRFFVRRRSELLSHLHCTQIQYNLPTWNKRLDRKANREGFAQRFPQGSISTSVNADCLMLDQLDELIHDLEAEIVRTAKIDDPATFHRLRSLPGIGKITAMSIFYEVPDFDRFDRVQEFASYSRLVAPRSESSGKLGASRGRKQGNVHLKFAFSEAAVHILRANPRAQKLHHELVRRHGKAKALSILAHKIGRAVFYMQKRKVPFDAERFYQGA